MLQLIDDETASRYYNEIDTATGDDLQTKMSALESWATAKKAEQHRQEWDQVSGVFTDFDNYSASEGLDAFDEESRYQYANRQFIAHQTGGKFEDQMFVYPSKRDEVTDQMFGKTGVSEKEAFNLFKGAVESRKASEEALRELPGVLAQGVLKSAGEGKQFDEVDSWFAFDGWKQRHADKLGAMPAGWETAMLDSAVKLHARTEALMADVAPESKRAMDVLMKFTRPEGSESLPDADRSDVENLAKDFAKLTPEQRDGIYATLSYAAEAGGAGLGKGFWEKVGEGVARGGVNIYDDAAMTAEDRQARQNISFFQDLLEKPQAEPDRMQTAESIQMQRDIAQDGLDKNKERLGELRVMREIRDLAQGRIDPIKTEMDGVLGSVVQGAYDFSQSAAYTGMAMIPYVGLPAVMGALANSNYLRMLDEYPDMDADAAYNLSLAIAGPQAVIERFQGGLLLGKLPYLNQAMKRLTDVRVPLPARLGLGYAGVVGAETVTELAQEAMPVVADQIASAVREDMPEFDSEKAWGEYREQAPKIFYSMLWGGLIGGGAVGIRELDRSGVFMRNVQELEMHGITGEAAQNIAAEQDSDKATTLFREAWDKRTPEDIQAGISKRAAMLDAAQATQANPDLPTRRVEQAPDGTTTHIIEQNGQTIYSTNDPAAADLALVNFTRMVDRGRITGTTNGIVEALSFFNQVNEAANRGDDVQKFILDNTPRTLLDEYEANPNEQNLDNLFKTVRTIGQDISEPAELANFPVLASNQGALAEGIFKSVIRIYEGATGDKVVRDVAQDNLKRAIAEQRITMDWVRENLNQIIPQIESERITQKLRTETDTDVIESFSDVALAYMRGNIRDEQIPAGFRGFLRRMAIVVKDIFRRAYRLKRAIADGKVDANFESFLADSVGLNQQARVDTARERVGGELTQGTFNYSIGSMPEDQRAAETSGQPSRGGRDAEVLSKLENAQSKLLAANKYKAKIENDTLTSQKIEENPIPEGAIAIGWDGSLLGLNGKEIRSAQENWPDPLQFFEDSKNSFTNESGKKISLDNLFDAWNFLQNTPNEFDKVGSPNIAFLEDATGISLSSFKSTKNDKDGLLFSSGKRVSIKDSEQEFLDAVSDFAGQKQKENADFIKWVTRENSLAPGGVMFYFKDGSLYLHRWTPTEEQIEVRGGQYDSKEYKLGFVKDYTIDTPVFEILKETYNRFQNAKNSSTNEIDISGLKDEITSLSNQISSFEKQSIANASLKDGFTLEKGTVYFNAKFRTGYSSNPTTDRKDATTGWILTSPKGGIIEVVNADSLEQAKLVIGRDSFARKRYFDLPNSTAPATGATNYSIGKKDSLRVKMTRTALTDAALNQASWKDWYEEHQSTLDEFFGDHAQLFQDILSVTSQAASVKANVGLALKAFGQFHRGEEFNGFLPAVIQNLTRLREKSNVRGQKISAYKNSNDGKVDEAVIDRHIARLIFGVDSPSKAQFAKAQKILTEIANEIGWTPRQVQAALWAHSIYKSGKTPESYGAYLKKLESRGTLAERIGDIGRRSGGSNADGGGRGRFAPESTGDGAGLTNYSIRSVEHFKNDKRFDKLVKDGRVVIGHDIEEFKGMHILLHSPDNAFAGTIKLTDGEEIQGKGGVYYPALYANKNYFWASTEKAVMTTATHLNEIGQKNGGKILMGLVSAPVEKLFSSTSMATGVVKFLNSLTSDTKAGLSKEDLNSMLVAASKVEFVKKGAKPKKFSVKLAESDGLEKNLSKVDALLEPTGSIFQVRKMFSESLADQLAKHLKANPESSNYVAGILADAENKHAKSAIKRGTLSKASIMQGLGNLFTEPFLRDFQDHGNGKIYAVLEVDGMVDGVASKAHDSYPFTLVPRNKKSKVKLHVLNQAVDWQDVVGRETGEYTTPEERIFLMPTSGMSAKTLKVLGVRGGSKANPLNYSIASQSEIDRVNRALGGMNRGPDARIAVYERAKAKFSTLLQNNQQALDNLRAGTVSFRRTQLLQALGELDAILSIFPPDIRGRVGGYTRLASIAPHDVFKDGEKVSEVSGMNGAIISAWMREGLSIGPAGQQTELPPGYTAKENLGTARADRAIADFFKKRIEMIDRELEKTLRREYDEAFRKLLDRTKPKKAAPGEKPKGIGGDIQDLFAVVRDSVDMSATQIAAHIAGLDAMIASGELTAEQEARAQVEAALVSLTGDWKNADADRRRTALMEASRIWNGAYATHTQKLIRQREEREIARAEAIVATGKAGELAGRKSKAISDSGLKGSWKDYILNLLNFDQVVGVLFGENSEISNTIIDKQRRAENAKEDGSQAKMQELEDFFTGLAGGKVLDGERLRYRLTQPSMTVDGIEMSELEALSAVMMWSQEDGRRHMEGEMDETGKPSGKWHYNQAFVDEILANLSTEALALRDWLGQRYASEYANINAVYSELNGVNLPQIRNYSPVTVQPVNAPTGQVLDPVSGSAMSGASTSPGALRTRGTAIAEPRFQDVLQTYISHTLQMEHWKSFAPMIAEANGILRNRDVQNSVEEKGGAEARKMLNAWLDYFAQGGTRDAGAHLALNQGLNNVLGRASQVALVGRASTLLIQSTQLGAALAEMPVKAYLKRMGKLLTGQLGWADAINSDYIQRRMKQMPPVVQLAMQGLKGAKPTAIQQAGKRLGMLLSGADGFFTAGTYAITYDYHLTKAKELGLAGQEAEDYARNTAERVTDRIAQPTRAGARSLYENTSTNPLARAGWAFASEARKNLAITAYSFAERDTATKLRTLAYVVALNSIGASILRSIWRDIMDDEDDDLFDDKYWSPKRIAIAMATEPFYGFPVLGSVVQEGVNKAFGEYKPSGSLFSVDRAIGPIKRLPDHLSGDTDLREVMRDIDMVVSALGIMHPNIAATASITHLAKDLFNLTDSTVDAVTEE